MTTLRTILKELGLNTNRGIHASSRAPRNTPPTASSTSTGDVAGSATTEEAISRTPIDNASQASTSRQNTSERKDMFVGNVSTIAKQSFPATGKTTDMISASDFPKANRQAVLVGKPMVDSNRLQKNAQKFGNKTANLMELNAFLENQECGLDKVVIPKFLGIDNASILEFIRNKRPGFDYIWQSFCKEYYGKGPSSTSKMALSSYARTRLASVRSKIRRAFDSSEDFQVDNQFLSSLAGQKLMVRSSGREDTGEVVNAGGNMSIAGVGSESYELNRAIGLVVESYFSEKSAQQRLIAGDDLAVLPIMSVLIQEMAGERIGGPVVTSGVIFTQEPEGSTPGIMKIQATWGHNEAVVSNSLPSDSYYIDRRGKAHGVCRPKTERLVPTYSITDKPLNRQTNPIDIQNIGTLDANLLNRLHKLGQEIEAYYGRPMDIEWTYDPEKDLIYLLQARPLLPSSNTEATHVDREKTQECPVLLTLVIGSGGGKVRCINDFSSLLTGKDLAQTLERYLNHPHKNTIQAIISEKNGDPTSHEATTFRGENIPVLWARDLEKLHTFFEMNSPALLDPGAGMFIGARQLLEKTGSPQDILQELSQREIVKPGWSKHPLPAQESIGSEHADLQTEAYFIYQLYAQLNSQHQKDQDACALANACQNGDEKNIQTNLVKILAKLDQSLPAVEAWSTGLGKNHLERLFAKAAQGNKTERTQAMARILLEAFKLTRMISRTPERKETAEGLLRSVISRASAAHNEAMRSFGSMAHLYELNWLKAALLQHADSELVAGDSYITLLNAHAQGSAGKNDYASSYALVDKLILRSEIAEQWKAFSTAITRDPAQNQRLARLLTTTQFFGMTANWVNTSFAEYCDHAKVFSADGCLDCLEKELSNPNTQKILRWVQQHKSLLEEWKRRITEWADPSSVEKLQCSFRKQVAPKYAEVATLYRNASPLDKRNLLHWLANAVELHDQSLKSLKGSTAFADTRVKAQHFHTLLGSYLEAMFTWAKEVPRLFDHGCHNAKRIFSRVQSFYESFSIKQMTLEKAAEQLRPSGKLLMDAAKIGSTTYLMGNRPETLEDLFMLTHQNLLTIIAAAHKDSGLNLHSLPKNLGALCAEISKASELLSIDYSYPKLSIEFNRSLNEHSLKCLAEYDLRKPERAQVSMTLYGDKEHNRHYRAMMYAALCGRSFGIPYSLEGAPQNKGFVTSWTWNVPFQDEVAQKFRETLPLFIDEVSETTMYKARHHKLEDILTHLKEYIPEINNEVKQLDYNFFRDHPWYNMEFVEILSDCKNLGEVLLAGIDSKEKPDFVILVADAAITNLSNIKPSIREQLASKLREAQSMLNLSQDEGQRVKNAIKRLNGTRNIFSFFKRG